MRRQMKVKNNKDKPQKIDSISYKDFLENNMREYGVYVVENRAIPDIHDGLKPVQRRILWSAYNMGAKSSGSTYKTARISGDCFAKGTPISTPNGKVAIENLRVGDTVLTSRGPNIVTRLFYNEKGKSGVLTLADGKYVVCTPGQEVKVKVGEKFFWKRVDELKEGDEIVVAA